MFKKITLFFFVLNLVSCTSILRSIIKFPQSEYGQISFEENKSSNYKFMYSDTTENTYLRKLRNEYNLTQLIGKTEKETVLNIMDWTHQQWEHNGSNQPSKPDALTILKEAKDGKKFRCVEYGVVLSSALNSLGIKARVLGLKTKDVETCKIAAGHVLAEVWLAESNKWALIDGQFNTMPTLDGVPLNAVELQKAIVEKKDVKLIDIKGELSAKRKAQYLGFMPIYLYFFNVPFDTRYIASKEKVKYNNKAYLMLVPLGAKNPTVFQRKYPIDYCEYTNSLQDFYAKPN